MLAPDRAGGQNCDSAWLLGRPLSGRPQPTLYPQRTNPGQRSTQREKDTAVGVLKSQTPPHDPHHGRYFTPQRLRTDKASGHPALRKWLRGKQVEVRIARKGIESSERLAWRRWVIERTKS